VCAGEPATCDDVLNRDRAACFNFRYRSPEHFLKVLNTYYGPMLKAVLVETGGPQAGPPVAPSCPTATGTIEIALGAAVVRVGPGTDLATLTKVPRAVKAAT
jgi:hypothetical protein